MANRIQIRHGSGTPTTTNLLPYELGWDNTNHVLYIREESGDPFRIGGSGTLSVAQGGTGATSFTANSLIISGSTTTSALTTRAITNNGSATAVAAGINIPTMNTLYYALPKFNNSKSYTSNSTFYAPTTGGTSGYILTGNGTTSAPVWVQTLSVAHGGTGLTTSTNVNAIITGNSTTATNAFTTIRTGNGALYATSQDSAATFGTLPVAQGGTGQTSIANIRAGKDSDGSTINTTYLKVAQATKVFRTSASLSSSGWYRFLVYGETLATIMEFNICIPYSQGSTTEAGEVHRIKYPTTYGGKAVFSDEYSSGETLLVDKIRRTYQDEEVTSNRVWGFDIHYTGDSARTVYIELVIRGNFNESNVTMVNLSSISDAPTGETVYPTYNFSQVTEGNITSLCSFTKTSGGTLTLDSVIRRGNMVSIEVHVKPTSSISAGDDIWKGTFNGPLPASGVSACGYYGSRSLVAQMGSEGGITFRNASSSSLSSGSESAYRFNYLTV